MISVIFFLIIGYLIFSISFFIGLLLLKNFVDYFNFVWFWEFGFVFLWLIVYDVFLDWYEI